jgi:hypothetical protein
MLFVAPFGDIVLVQPRDRARLPGVPVELHALAAQFSSHAGYEALRDLYHTLPPSSSSSRGRLIVPLFENDLRLVGCCCEIVRLKREVIKLKAERYILKKILPAALKASIC